MKFKFVIKPKDTKVFTEFLQNIQGDTFKVGEVEVAIKYDVRSFIFICEFGSLITHKELENADGIYESVAGYVRDAVDKINTNKSKKRRDAEDAVISLFGSTKENAKEETIKTEIDKFLNMFGPMFAPTAKTAVNKPIDKTEVSSKDTYFEDLVDKINKDSLNLVGKENKKETKYSFEKGVEKIINDFLEEFDLKGNKEDKPFSVEDWK